MQHSNHSSSRPQSLERQSSSTATYDSNDAIASSNSGGQTSATTAAAAATTSRGVLAGYPDLVALATKGNIATFLQSSFTLLLLQLLVLFGLCFCF